MPDDRTTIQAASKLVTAVMGRDWNSVGLPVYRGFLDRELIPKSSGRNIKLATPETTATVMLGVAFDFASPARYEAIGAHDLRLWEAVELVKMACRGGSGFLASDGLLAVMCRFLTDGAAAAEVQDITIDLDDFTAILTRTTGQQERFIHDAEEMEGDAGTSPLRTTVAIDGAVFRALHNSIRWGDA